MLSVCGIGGTYAADGANPDAALAAMVARMRHRGPDDEGTTTVALGAATAGLCATRLAIRDLSAAGHQPMAGPSGSVIAFNGEIYNANALRRDLTRLGHRFRGGSDTEVVLAGWEEWRSDVFPRLRGMFALAIADPRNATLILARDPLGVKPLYVARVDGDVAFASEIAALLASGLLAPRLSVHGLAGFLELGAPIEPDTIIEGCAMLAPGTALSVSPRGIGEQRWFSLADAFRAPAAVDPRAAPEAVRAALQTAVERHLVSDVPIGVFLSGGLDSTAIVALSAAAAGPLPTFSIVFREPEYSEKPWIDAATRAFGTAHRELTLGVDDFLDELPEGLAAMDQPTVDGLNTYVVAGATKRAGLTVALSGLGGDELFAGYELFRTAPRLDRWSGQFPRLPLALARRLAVRAGGGDRALKLARWLAGDRSSAYALQRELIEPELRMRLLGGVETPRRAPAAPLNDANDVSLTELSHFMLNLLLRDSDVMSMAHSLELRVPLLDQDLVELVASLPAALKVAGGQPKPLLQAAVGDMLPDAVRTRPKAGFTLPFARWLRGELHEAAREVLLDRTVGGPLAELIDARAVADVWHGFLAGRTSWSRPWALYVVKRWAERALAPAPAQHGLRR